MEITLLPDTPDMLVQHSDADLPNAAQTPTGRPFPMAGPEPGILPQRRAVDDAATPSPRVPSALLGEGSGGFGTSLSEPPLKPLDKTSGGPIAEEPRGDDWLAQVEASLPQVYVVLQDPVAQRKHHGHQKAVESALTSLRAGIPYLAPQEGGEDFRDLVARALPNVLQDIKFQPDIYAAKSAEQGGYGRYLLHSDSTSGANFCLQVFAFDPGQKTPIHNHPNECASFIAHGALLERLYDDGASAVERNGEQLVAKRPGKHARPQGSWAGFNRDELDIPHSLKNKSPDLAVSVHLYRDMDGISDGAQVAAKERFGRLLST